MPTDQPNSATNIPEDAREDATAAAVLHDEQLDDTPGGGGLGGLAADDPLGGSARSPRGTSPNAPVDTGVDSGDAGAGAEARVLRSQTGVSETGAR